jgi:hypothetical protein
MTRADLPDRAVQPEWPVPGHYGTCGVNRDHECTCNPPARAASQERPHPDLEERLAFALEARDVQRGGSPHVTPGNRFYREAAASLIALMPPAQERPSIDVERWMADAANELQRLALIIEGTGDARLQAPHGQTSNRPRALLEQYARLSSPELVEPGE